MNFLVVKYSRHGLRILIALSMAYLVSLYIGHSSGWFMAATFFVMLTQPGNAFYQGILHCFVMLLCIVIGSFLFQATSGLSARLASTLGGSALGIAVNVFILQDRIDILFRQAMVSVLQAWTDYLSALVPFLFDKKNPEWVGQQKLNLAKNLQYMPLWIYSAGFDRYFQPGHRYFFMKVYQMTEMLFALHPLVRSLDEKELLFLRPLMLQWMEQLNAWVKAIIDILSDKRPDQRPPEFVNMLECLRQAFPSVYHLSFDFMEHQQMAFCLAEFVYGLQESAEICVQLWLALRGMSDEGQN